MAKREPLFPFYISDSAAYMRAKRDSEFVAALEREDRFNHITELRVSGRVEKNKTLTLNGWASCDNGFILSAGSFWNKAFELSDAEFDRLVECELSTRAAREIAAEEEAKLLERVEARAALIRKELL